jgi:hypothetical protein
MEEPIEKEEIMKIALRAVSLSIVLLALLHAPSAMAQAEPSNPAMDKFKEDMKAAVLNGSITVPQVKRRNLEGRQRRAFTGRPGRSSDSLPSGLQHEGNHGGGEAAGP